MCHPPFCKAVVSHFELYTVNNLEAANLRDLSSLNVSLLREWKTLTCSAKRKQAMHHRRSPLPLLQAKCDLDNCTNAFAPSMYVPTLLVVHQILVYMHVYISILIYIYLYIFIYTSLLENYSNLIFFAKTWWISMKIACMRRPWTFIRIREFFPPVNSVSWWQAAFEWGSV